MSIAEGSVRFIVAEGFEVDMQLPEKLVDFELELQYSGVLSVSMKKPVGHCCRASKTMIAGVAMLS